MRMGRADHRSRRPRRDTGHMTLIGRHHAWQGGTIVSGCKSRATFDAHMSTTHQDVCEVKRLRGIYAGSGCTVERLDDGQILW